MSDRTNNLILVYALVQIVVYLDAADEKLNYNHQDSGIISVLLKKIRDLEERDREFDSKLKEIGVLTQRLDEVRRQLLNMQEIENRLEKAEEKIQMLVSHADNNTVNTSGTLKVMDTNGTHDTISINSSSPMLIKHYVSSTEARQTEMGDTTAELVSSKSRIQTALRVTAIKYKKRSVTRKLPLQRCSPTLQSRLHQADHFSLIELITMKEMPYDTNTGIFTCPVSGTYFFFTNIQSMYHTGPIKTEIVFEGQGKGEHMHMIQTMGIKEVSLHAYIATLVSVYGTGCGRFPILGEMYSSFTAFFCGRMMLQQTATDTYLLRILFVTNAVEDRISKHHVYLQILRHVGVKAENSLK